VLPGSVPDLRRLSLAHSGLREGDMTTIRDLPQLTDLDLDSCAIGEAGRSGRAGRVETTGPLHRAGRSRRKRGTNPCSSHLRVPWEVLGFFQ
jgi:hypothetical protein